MLFETWKRSHHFKLVPRAIPGHYLVVSSRRRRKSVSYHFQDHLPCPWLSVWELQTKNLEHSRWSRVKRRTFPSEPSSAVHHAHARTRTGRFFRLPLQDHPDRGLQRGQNLRGPELQVGNLLGETAEHHRGGLQRADRWDRGEKSEG